jgi:ElaB/YqjD/DUF883 family membrane-anchored ribosome-binding protein
MDQQTLLTVMTAFVIIAAIALIIQAAMLVGIYKSSRALQQNVQRLMPQIERVLEISRQTIEDGRKQIAEITAKTSEILETTRKQVHRIDAFMDDASVRARVQFDRAEMVLDDAMGRTQRTLAMVERGILKPIVQVQGVAAGLKSAITVLLRGRPNPEEAHSDEEMFI